MTDAADGRVRGRAILALATIGLLAVGVAGGWALRTMLAPAPDVLDGQLYTLVTAEHGSVGRSLRLNTTAAWTTERVVANQAAGTVTSLALDAGAEVRPGDVLYTVNLRPVVAAEGEVPAFRDLAPGAEGADVAQLQQLLRTLGYEVGSEDGRFGPTVNAAVRAWQRDLGMEVDGVVRRGDLAFVPELPARLALDPELRVGAGLAGGEPAVQVLPMEPTFTIVLPENQARLVAPGTAVEIPRDGGEPWHAEVTEVRRATDEAASPVAVLAGTGGEPICRDQCRRLSVQEEVLLDSRIQVVPERSGVTVPAAAVVTTAAGDTVVVLATGELRPVEVVASASGTAVIEGVEAGARVRTPGELPAEDDPDSR